MTGPGESATSGGPTPEEDAAAGLPPVPSDLTEAESREVGERGR